MTHTTLPDEILKTDAMGRVRTPKARREALLAEFARSGVSGKKFAALVAVNYQTFASWVQQQHKTFNTPAFPGFPSGHSTFSRAAAEALTFLTGSASFPGGLGHHTVAANSMQIDLGPSAAVDLQWNTYYDAADQAGQSRRWGGIHPSEDDFTARMIGAEVGKAAFALAEKYWTGAIASEAMLPQITVLPGGNVRLAWNAVRGMSHKVQTSPDLITWTDATSVSVISSAS